MSAGSIVAFATVLAAFASGQEPFPARVLTVTADLVVIVVAAQDGVKTGAVSGRGVDGASDSSTVGKGRETRVRLQGLDLPAAPVRPTGTTIRLRDALRRRLCKDGETTWWIEPDIGPPPGTPEGEVVAMVRARKRGPSVNEEMLRRGLALLSCRTREVADLEELLAAAKEAQRAHAGWFAGHAPRRFETLPYLRGAVIGLHHQEPHKHYHRQLDELAAAGFQHVCLLFSAFVDRVDSSVIRRDHVRTVRDGRLIETIGYARRKGMSVMLLPIVLILNAGEDDWRGVLRPAEESAFWQEYDRFLAHYLDIAEQGGVEIFCVGSEFGSLEDRTETWERLVANARGRFGGLLTYSANWDHGHAARFFPALDFIGLTAYFTLTKKKDPTLEELVAAWRRVAGELETTFADSQLPLVFTELGYASQDGINSAPWNYTLDKERVDLAEQELCFRAFRQVAPDIQRLRGAYFFDYYDFGGAADWSYSPRGKPAMAEWRAWAVDAGGSR